MSEQVKLFVFEKDNEPVNYGGAVYCEEHDEMASAGDAFVRKSDYDALHAEAEPLRAENGRLQSACDHNKTCAQVANELADRLAAELESARGLLREVELLAEAREHGYAERQHGDVVNYRCANAVVEMLPRIQAFLTTTPAPEVQAEQGERQEAEYPWRRREGVLGCKRFMSQRCYEAQSDRMKANYEPNTPQPSQDVRALVDDLVFLADYIWRDGCGHDMPNYLALGRYPLDVAKAALTAHRQAQRK